MLYANLARRKRDREGKARRMAALGTVAQAALKQQWQATRKARKTDPASIEAKRAKNAAYMAAQRAEAAASATRGEAPRKMDDESNGESLWCFVCSSCLWLYNLICTMRCFPTHTDSTVLSPLPHVYIVHPFAAAATGVANSPWVTFLTFSTKMMAEKISTEKVVYATPAERSKQRRRTQTDDQRLKTTNQARERMAKFRKRQHGGAADNDDYANKNAAISCATPSVSSLSVERSRRWRQSQTDAQKLRTAKLTRERMVKCRARQREIRNNNANNA
jgi:hypothetical protein